MHKGKPIVGAVSGGFDPLHVGHVRLMREARSFVDELIVIVNNDNWLIEKKGYVFMPEDERVEMLMAYNFVNKVVLTKHVAGDPDRSVTQELRWLRPDIFFNGGDRTQENTPEDAVCDELGIQQVYGVGAGGKVQSSSWLTRDALQGLVRSVRPWGHFNSLDKGDGWNLKTITVAAGQRISLQQHRLRDECWVLVEGDAVATAGLDMKTLHRIPMNIGEMVRVPVGYIHRLESANGGTIVEIALGDFDENDIVRLQDDYART